MRILLALAIVLAGCSKKKEEAAPAPAAEPKTAEAPKPQPPAPAPPTAGDDEKPTPTESAPAASAPTKEAAILRLKEVLAALEAKQWEKASTYFAFPAAERPKNLESMLGKLIELNEISAKGIDILAAKGKWGKLAEVFEPERAASWAQKFAVPVDECYGFNVEGAKTNASVGFHWDGTELKLIRLNNVGKLE